MTFGQILDALHQFVIFVLGGTFGEGASAVTYTGLVPQVATYITSHPLVLLFVLIPLVGLGVGMFKRLINVN